MLAFIARNFPQEPSTSKDEPASIVRSLIQDFGYRFVFKKGREKERVAPDFTPRKLLKDWVNPVGKQHNKRAHRIEREYRDKCIRP
jgi:hypothetical protein